MEYTTLLDRASRLHLDLANTIQNFIASPELDHGDIAVITAAVTSLVAGLAFANAHCMEIPENEWIDVITRDAKKIIKNSCNT